MPRLPRVLVTEGVDAPKGASIPFSAAESGVGEAAQYIGANLTRAVDIYARAEQHKRDVATRQEISTLSAEWEREAAAGDAALALERDDQEYLRQHGEMLTKIQTDIRSRVKNPDAAQALEIKLNGLRAHREAAAYKHANALFIDQGKRNLDDTLDTRKNLAGLAGDDETFRRHFQEGLVAIDAAVPVIGPEDAGKRRRTFREETLNARALNEANTDPEGFVENADGRFRDLDAKVRESLKETARNKVESNRKSANAEWEKYYKRIEDEAESERRAQITKLEADALAGRLSIRQLDDARAMRIVDTREEYKALHTAITAEPKETPSDPASLTFVQLRTRGATPGITSKMLDSLFTTGKLNRKDWLEEKGKLQGRIDHLKAEGRTEQNQEQAQAEQVLKAGLDLTAPQDKWDLQDAQLYARALDELTSRSKAFGGQENALEVARELGERYAPIRQQRIKLKVEDYKRSLPAVLQSDTADKALKLLDEMRKSGAFPQAQTDTYRRTILDWKRRERSMEETGKPGESKLRPEGNK